MFKMWLSVCGLWLLQGMPSGEAFIQMMSEAAAEKAAKDKHGVNMILNNNQRFIEVFQCSGDDMQMVLSNGIIPSTIPGGNGPPQQPQVLPLPTGLAPGMMGPSPVTVMPKAMGFSTEPRLIPQGEITADQFKLTENQTALILNKCIFVFPRT